LRIVPLLPFHNDLQFSVFCLGGQALRLDVYSGYRSPEPASSSKAIFKKRLLSCEGSNSSLTAGRDPKEQTYAQYKAHSLALHHGKNVRRDFGTHLTMMPRSSSAWRWLSLRCGGMCGFRWRSFASRTLPMLQATWCGHPWCRWKLRTTCEGVSARGQTRSSLQHRTNWRVRIGCDGLVVRDRASHGSPS
jgi:hypothetical protein